MLKYCADSQDRLAAIVPACFWWRTSWVPSGLLQTYQQLRDKAQELKAMPQQLKVDLLKNRRFLASSAKARLKGPCVFGCTTSTAAHATSKARERWYRVPNPSPWPAIDPGNTLCMRCYAWGVSNPRARKRKMDKYGQGDTSIRVNQQYRICDLVNRPDLNGVLVTALHPPDDHDKVLVENHSGDRFRLHFDKLRAPCSDVGPPCPARATAKRRLG